MRAPLLVSSFVSCMVLIAGCGASKQLLTDTQDALQRCTQELNTCEADLSGCRTETDTLTESLNTQAALHEECLRTTRNADAAAHALREREAALRQQLAEEITARDVTIENLQNRLAVKVLDKILFRSGSATILPAGKNVLDKVANVIKPEDTGIRVEGHTDNVPIGTELKRRYPTNWELSGARAASVVRYFEVSHDIRPERMEAVGHSEYHPVAPNDSPDNQQKNRRVEIVLTALR